MRATLPIRTAGTDRLWVLCPVYKDVESFLILRRRLVDVIQNDSHLRGRALTFVVVDDAAGFDQEISQLESADDVVVVQPPFNLGHQRAIVYGIRKVTSGIRDEDILITMDADGEDRPEDLPALVAPLFTSDQVRKAIALARRTTRHETWSFRLMYLCFRILFRIVTGTNVRTGNYAAYSGWMARRIVGHPHFDLCYSSSFISLDLPVEMVPCPRGVRYAGQSRMKYSGLIMHGVRMLMPFAERMAIRALILFSLTFTAGLLMGLAVVLVRLLTAAAVPGWATFSLLLVMLLSFIALGNFVLLFALFAQSRSISLVGIDKENDPPHPDPPPLGGRELKEENGVTGRPLTAPD
jgi:hypothetical protein